MFKDKYPDAVHHEQFYHKGDTVMKFDGNASCGMCSEDTSFCTISFECGICSEECLDNLWGEFEEAYNRTMYIEVTEDMAIDAGDPDLEGQMIEW